MMKKLFEKMATQFQSALAENVQNYIFILNIFYLKKYIFIKKFVFWNYYLYLLNIFIFKPNIFAVTENIFILSLKEIYLYPIEIHLYLIIFSLLSGFIFYAKNIIIRSEKRIYSMKSFYSLVFSSRIWSQFNCIAALGCFLFDRIEVHLHSCWFCIDCFITLNRGKFFSSILTGS